MLNSVDGTAHLIDVFADNSFVDEDFDDMDHLGETGAVKLTAAVLNVVEQLGENTVR